MGEQKQGWQEQGGQRPGDQRSDEQHLGGQRLAGQAPPPPGYQPPPVAKKGQDSESFVLRTYTVGRMGVRELYWLTGEGGASFPPGRRDHPYVGMCGGLLAQILILLQTPLFILCMWGEMGN